MSRDDEIAEMLQAHALWLSSAKQEGARIELNAANLDGYDFSGRDLNGAIFHACSMRACNFSNCQLYHADFAEAELENANFKGASLMLADFSGANLSEADLSDSRAPAEDSISHNRRGPRFTEAKLQGVNFQNAYLQQSDFSGAQMHQANFCNANLQGATFSACDLSELNFSGANMQSVDMQASQLRAVNLSGARLGGAQLQGSDLSQANVKAADMRSANLERCKLDEIQYSRECRFKGVRLVGCYGSARFKRFAQDQDYIEEFKEAHPWAFWLWFIVTDCGRSMSRVALSALGLSFFFGVLFYLLGPEAFTIHNPDGLRWNLFTTIYYSVVTFTTLGFGDITPNTPLAASVVIAEVIVGYVMLGILISILATKVARRS